VVGIGAGRRITGDGFSDSGTALDTCRIWCGKKISVCSVFAGAVGWRRFASSEKSDENTIPPYLK